VNMFSVRLAETAVSLRRLEGTSNNEDERAHWRTEAERFEGLAELAATDPAEARRRYQPTRSYEEPVAEYVSVETAYGTTTRHPRAFRVF
jgi:hypothetical protein